MDQDCLFCKIVAGEIPSYKIFEDDDFMAITDIQPVNLGHALLIPKAHYKNLFDLPDRLLGGLGVHLQKLALAIKTATAADGINLGMNNETAAGQLIFHAHFHIIPRFTGDGFEHWHGQTKPTPEDLTAITEKIKSNFTK